MVTMLGRSPGHLPASLPGPSPRTSPRLCLVTRLALGQGLGGTRGPLPGSPPAGRLAGKGPSPRPPARAVSWKRSLRVFCSLSAPCCMKQTPCSSTEHLAGHKRAAGGCGGRRGPGAGPVGRPSAPRRGRPGGHDAAGAELRRGQGCRGRQAAGSHALQRPQQAWKACQESLRGRRSGVRKRGQSGHPEPGRKRPPEGGEEGEDSRLGKALLGTRNQEGPDGWVPGTGRSWP